MCSESQHSTASIRMVILLTAVLIMPLLLSGCNTQPVKSENTTDFSSLGDANAKLAYNTEFPVASAQEAVIKGDAAYARGDMERALFEYIRALDQEGADADVLYKIGRLHAARVVTGRAELAFSWALRTQSDHVGSLLEIGVLQVRQRQYDAAREHLNRALAIRPALPRASNALGVIADVQGKYTEAQVHYEKALAIGGQVPQYINNLGYSRFLSGDQSGATDAFETALKLDPTYERAWRNLALVYAKQERYDKAIEAFAKTEELHQAYNDVGFIAMVAGRNDDANLFFDEAMRLSPTYYELAQRNAQRLGVTRNSGVTGN